jgi:hypothetical protein
LAGHDEDAYAKVRLGLSLDVAFGWCFVALALTILRRGRWLGWLGGVDRLAPSVAKFLDDLEPLAALFGGKLHQSGQLGLGDHVFVRQAAAAQRGSERGKGDEGDRLLSLETTAFGQGRRSGASTHAGR